MFVHCALNKQKLLYKQLCVSNNRRCLSNSCSEPRNKDSIGALYHSHFVRETTPRFPIQMASNAANVSMSWYHGDSWWRHQMETFSALLAICAGNSPVPGEFPTQRPVTRSFVFFDLRLNKRLSKQSWGWWLETISRPLWRHRNVINTLSTDVKTHMQQTHELLSRKQLLQFTFLTRMHQYVAIRLSLTHYPTIQFSIHCNKNILL